jgi:hypothetical protein
MHLCLPRRLTRPAPSNKLPFPLLLRLPLPLMLQLMPSLSLFLRSDRLSVLAKTHIQHPTGRRISTTSLLRIAGRVKDRLNSPS